MNDKSELLDQLTIDRSAPVTTGWPVWVAIGMSITAAIVGGFVALKVFPPQPTELAQTPPAKTSSAETASTSPSSNTNNAQAPTASSTSSEPDNRILNASGYITARRIATVSSQITGLITEVNVEEGMEVESGQVLAKLDDAVALVNLKLAESQLDVQKAQIESTRANLKEADIVLNRARDLRAKNLTSVADLTRSEAQAESLSAQLQTALASISVAKNEVQRQRESWLDHTIRAPFSGIVTQKNAQTGEIVSPGSAGGGFTRTGICTIVDMDSLEIEVDVNESFIGRVFAGQQVEANLDAYPDWTIPASVIAIIPTADRAKATVKVRIRIDQKDARILPDMGVKVAFLST